MLQCSKSWHPRTREAQGLPPTTPHSLQHMTKPSQGGGQTYQGSETTLAREGFERCSGFLQEVGCGQDLSHLVALLLMWLSEEDTFWALVELMENKKYAMSGRYMGMVGSLHRLVLHGHKSTRLNHSPHSHALNVKANLTLEAS